MDGLVTPVLYAIKAHAGHGLLRILPLVVRLLDGPLFDVLVVAGSVVIPVRLVFAFLVLLLDLPSCSLDDLF